MNIPQEIKKRIASKADQSNSAYRIGGCAFSKKGEVLGFAVNATHRICANIEGKSTGRHVEAELIRRYCNKIKTIVILRIGHGGDIRPIKPCPNCSKLAEKYNIRIISIEPPEE